MPFSFPSNPSLNQQSSQNGRLYQWDGYVWNLVGNIAGHASTHTSSGTDPITISSSQISNFNGSVSGLVSGVYAPLSGKLNQFASTTSAELFSVISNETGSGILVFNTDPTFSGSITVPSGNFSSGIKIGTNNLTTTNSLNIINSANLYLWSTFR